VAEAVDGVIEEMRASATERGITIAVAPARVRASVSCANGVLASVLSNLLRNAIKHMGSSARRQIEVRIDARNDRVRFEVQDTGPGLPPELIAHVFDPYVRGARTSEPGLGLGLATVRRLVEGHNGRYGVVSRPGDGATFWFELPAAEHGTPPHEMAAVDHPPVEQHPVN
jgi:signal transduction histidine kinase